VAAVTKGIDPGRQAVSQHSGNLNRSWASREIEIRRESSATNVGWSDRATPPVSPDALRMSPKFRYGRPSRARAKRHRRSLRLFVRERIVHR
jgi:hypothetical protein